MSTIIATHTLGKLRSYGGKRFVGAVIELHLENGHLLATFRLKSSPGALDSQQTLDAKKIYLEIEDWALKLRSVSDLREVRFPVPSREGKWPPLDGVSAALSGRGIRVSRE